MTSNTTSSLPNREKSRVTNESRILKPANIRVHTDDWPCFALKGVVVYREDGKSLANLLDAELDGPLIVQGQLHLEKGQKSHLISSYSKGQPIEISDVREFSFDEDGNIWAKGKAGWFEVQPAPPYKEIYEAMVAGVGFYFFTTDLHLARARKKRNGSMAELDIPFIIDDYIKKKARTKSSEEIIELIKRNGGFLMSMMRKPHKVQWKQSIIYNWLAQELPDIYCKFDDVRVKANRKTSNSKTVDSSVASAIIVQKMGGIHSTGRCLRQRLTLSLLSKILHEDYELDSVLFAQELVGAHAQAISGSLGVEWSESPILTELSNILSSPNRSTFGQKHLLKTTLRPRGNVLEYVEISSDDVEDDPRPKMRGHNHNDEDQGDSEVYGYPYERVNTSRKGKTVESTNQTSGKQRTRGERDMIPGSSKSGKMASLRLKRSSPLRDEEDVSNSLDLDNERPRKIQRTLRSQRIRDEAQNHVEEALTSEDEEESGDDEEQEIEEDNKELVLVEENLPTLEPQGPDGQWICPKSDCGYLIYKADEAEGQESIKEHYAEHTVRTQEQLDRINLVKQESRPHLPISHLLEKLKRLGEEAMEKEKQEINGRAVPQPIKRERVMGL